jgi:hypothetical protein
VGGALSYRGGGGLTRTITSAADLVGSNSALAANCRQEGHQVFAVSGELDKNSDEDPNKMKTVLAFMVVIVLTTVAQGQEVDPTSELVRANDIFLKLAVQLNNLPADPLERIVKCQTFLPQLDDAFRIWMHYGDASGEADWKIKIQGTYDAGRQAILSIMADSERQLAHPASVVTP